MDAQRMTEAAYCISDLPPINRTSHFSEKSTNPAHGGLPRRPRAAASAHHQAAALRGKLDVAASKAGTLQQIGQLGGA